MASKTPNDFTLVGRSAVFHPFYYSRVLGFLPPGATLEDALKLYKRLGQKRDLTSDIEVPAMTNPTDKDPQLQAIENMAKSLSPEDRARAFVEYQIEMLTQEAVATSAIEGIILDPKAVRRAILRQMGRRAGLF